MDSSKHDDLSKNTEKNTEKISGINVSIAILKNKFEQLNNSLERLENHYEKMNEIYANLLKIITVHQEKIERYAIEDSKMAEKIAGIWTYFDEMKSHLSTLRQDINNIESKLIEAIAVSKRDSETYTNEVTDKISQRTSNLEKATYVILAGVVILSFFLANADKIGAFFKAMVLVAPN